MKCTQTLRPRENIMMGHISINLIMIRSTMKLKYKRSPWSQCHISCFGLHCHLQIWMASWNLTHLFFELSWKGKTELLVYGSALSYEYRTFRTSTTRAGALRQCLRYVAAYAYICNVTRYLSDCIGNISFVGERDSVI